MKTTVEVPDSLFQAARTHCAAHGITFRELIERGLREVLEKPAREAPFRLCAFGFGGEGQQVHEWAEIRSLIYAGHGSDGSGEQ